MLEKNWKHHYSELLLNNCFRYKPSVILCFPQIIYAKFQPVQFNSSVLWSSKYFLSFFFSSISWAESFDALFWILTGFGFEAGEKKCFNELNFRITSQEVSKAINSLKCGKASGKDGI